MVSDPPGLTPKKGHATGSNGVRPGGSDTGTTNELTFLVGGMNG
jgi:hypothetical protein